MNVTSIAPAKRSQHANATYRNIVGRNMLRAFGHPVVATCCDVLGVVGSSLKMAKFEQQHPTPHNMSQQGGQTHATSCAQQCCDILRWHVAIVWPGLNRQLALLCNNRSMFCVSIALPYLKDSKLNKKHGPFSEPPCLFCLKFALNETTKGKSYEATDKRTIGQCCLLHERGQT